MLGILSTFKLPIFRVPAAMEVACGFKVLPRLFPVMTSITKLSPYWCGQTKRANHRNALVVHPVDHIIVSTSVLSQLTSLVRS